MAVRIVAAEIGMTEAVERLRSGKLVAFPTETVYGLGANALDADAVASIFAAKGRPSTNPVIVHVADSASARELTSDWTPVAEELANKYWAGPLTLVLRKTDAIPDIVTAGGDTVGIRVPNHPVALELLRRSGIPIAAPSANRSEEVSPTTAQHVADSLGPWVDDLLILDGGACEVGIESTVIDATGDVPHILRPGMITLDTAPIATLPSPEDAPARSPGQMLRHYAPSVPVLLLFGESIRNEYRPGDGIIQRFDTVSQEVADSGQALLLPSDPAGYASLLYAALRELDTRGVRRILIEIPPHAAEWDAIRDRLHRAATTKSGVE